MNSELKQLIAIMLQMILTVIMLLSLFTINLFRILIGIFGIHWLWQNLDKFV